MDTEDAHKDKKHFKHLRRTLLVVAAFIVAALISFCAYFSLTAYHPDSLAQSALQSDSSVRVEKKTSYMVFAPTSAVNGYGLAFYPGAKVDEDAYAPLLRRLAERGWTCVALDEPLNFAFLNISAADNALSDFPDVSHWYVGGHSLGGVVASIYASEHADALEGVVFLASYPNADLSKTGLRAISIYGSCDGVLKRDEYEAAKPKLPADNIEHIIEGGNHAQFGSYGAQDGDNEATISAEEQWDETLDVIIAAAERSL